MWNNFQPNRNRIRFFPHIVPIAFPLIFPFGIVLLLHVLGMFFYLPFMMFGFLPFHLFHLFFWLLPGLVILAVIWAMTRRNHRMPWGQQPQQTPYYQPQQPYYQPQQPYYQPTAQPNTAEQAQYPEQQQTMQE
jgi:hypothetical protein